MRGSPVECGATGSATPAHAVAVDDPVRTLFLVLPRPLRFLGVGGLGLIVDLAVFTLLIAHTFDPLVARLGSLGIATLLTWRLNRALTFDHSGRRTADEALRYAAVAAAAQAVSYGVFAFLVIGLLAAMPQLAVIIGAAVGALASYLGQAGFAFRPQHTA